MVRTVKDAGRQTIDLDEPALVIGAMFIPEGIFAWDTEANE